MTPKVSKPTAAPAPVSLGPAVGFKRREGANTRRLSRSTAEHEASTPQSSPDGSPERPIFSTARGSPTLAGSAPVEAGPDLSSAAHGRPQTLPQHAPVRDTYPSLDTAYGDEMLFATPRENIGEDGDAEAKAWGDGSEPFMQGKHAFYAVRVGRTTGIFTNWSATKAASFKFPGEMHKGFSTRAEAFAWLHDVTPSLGRPVTGATPILGRPSDPEEDDAMNEAIQEEAAATADRTSSMGEALWSMRTACIPLIPHAADSPDKQGALLFDDSESTGAPPSSFPMPPAAQGEQQSERHMDPANRHALVPTMQPSMSAEEAYEDEGGFFDSSQPLP
ncbi:hypothetical protein P7C70_g9526, partial [Phenoliferia sp. Uapishka_3]